MEFNRIEISALFQKLRTFVPSFASSMHIGNHRFFILCALAIAACLACLAPACLPEAPKHIEAEKTTLPGSRETCLKCHADYTGLSPSHDPAAIGCTPCHLGNPYAQSAESAHQDMVLVPGNLSSIRQTCGSAGCHADIAGRVENSLMNTMSGVVAVDRFVFGEAPNPDGHHRIQALGNESPADRHLRQLCASCHLGNEKTEPGPVSASARGGGCTACHLDYSGSNQTPAERKFHPDVNLMVRNEHCFGCHSRSGRISTNYEGWHETRLTPTETKGKKGYRVLPDGRVFSSAMPDAHHRLGLECIDCHSSTEIMGDGRQYTHEEEAVRIQCGDCHFAQTPATIAFDELSLEDQKILQLRRADYQNARFVKGSKGQGISNVFIDAGGKARMAAKNSGKKYVLTPPAAVCTRGKAHRDLSCSACHTAWAPQCIGCHNTYDPRAQAYDLLDKKPATGKWTEHLGEFFAEPPTLGVRQRTGGRSIQPFLPGMILSIDPGGFPGWSGTSAINRRLFAPAAPHTTAAKGRSCLSCHANSLALGYGRGELTYLLQGHTATWHFESEYAAVPPDQLPQDAWIGFLTEPPSGNTATRTDARPFNLAEQKRILRVGACLQCHKENSKVMNNCLDDFEGTLRGRSPRCILPEGW